MKVLHAVAEVSDRHWFIAPIAALLAMALLVSRMEPARVVESAITQDVKPGGIVTTARKIEWRNPFCRDYVSQGWLVDSLKITHIIEPQRRGYPYPARSFRHDVPVPFSMPWGDATFKIRVSVNCPPFYDLWPITFDFPDLQFHVSPP